MTQRAYRTYDVFTDTPLTGNPLAVVMDSDGLDDAAMQKIAAEFNYSETVFVAPPKDARHRAAIRIFTPHYEMPFAGHPTVGTAIALAESGYGGSDAAVFVIEEKIGPVRCAVRKGEGVPYAEFDLPKLSMQLDLSVEKEVVCTALGLDPQDIGFDNHTVGLWSAGVPYITIPLRDLAAAGRARLDVGAWLALAPTRDNGAPACAYLYCRETIGHDVAFHARMFAPDGAGYEDPATGSAAAAFSGAVNHFDRPLDGPSSLWIEQGVEMERPSRLRLEMDVAGGQIKAARIGGHAVKIIDGMLAV